MAFTISKTLVVGYYYYYGLNWILNFLGFNTMVLCYADSTDVSCLKGIKASLEDPNDYLSLWDFSNSTEGFICNFEGIECWHPYENKVLTIDLSDTGLQGQFPRSLKNCSSLTSLDLSKNKLSGVIPSDITKLVPWVTKLDLSSNNFSGEIPVNLANFSFLNTLKLDNNRLTGQIPPEFGQLPRIKTFSVAHNLLSGKVPVFSNAKFSANIYANNPGLCGEPLAACPSSARKNNNREILIGATIGIVAFTIIVFVVVAVWSEFGRK